MKRVWCLAVLAVMLGLVAGGCSIGGDEDDGKTMLTVENKSSYYNFEDTAWNAINLGPLAPDESITVEVEPAIAPLMVCLDSFMNVWYRTEEIPVGEGQHVTFTIVDSTPFYEY